MEQIYQQNTEKQAKRDMHSDPFAKFPKASYSQPRKQMNQSLLPRSHINIIDLLLGDGGGGATQFPPTSTAQAAALNSAKIS